MGRGSNWIYLQECYQSRGLSIRPVFHYISIKSVSSVAIRIPDCVCGWYGWREIESTDEAKGDLTQQSQFEWVTDLVRFVNECVITTQQNTSRANIPVTLTFVTDQENWSHVLEISSTSDGGLCLVPRHGWNEMTINTWTIFHDKVQWMSCLFCTFFAIL